MLANPDNNNIPIHNYYQDIADIYVIIMVIYHPLIDYYLSRSIIQYFMLDLYRGNTDLL